MAEQSSTSSASSSSSLNLQTPVQFVKGIGPERAALLNRLEIHTAQDLLFFFPRDYVDVSERSSIRDLVEGKSVSLVVEVMDFEQRSMANGHSILGVLLRQDDAYVRAVWFNQPYMLQRFRRGQTVLVSGAPRMRGLRWEFRHPRITLLDADAAAPRDVLPIYSLTEGLKQHQLRRWTAFAADQLADTVPEVFPASFLASRSLCSIAQALREVHTPTGPDALAEARRRLVYQELFVMQIGLALRQQQLLARQAAIPLPWDARIDARICRLFPYELTPDQRQAIEEIRADMGRNIPMNRLLQGDVGTGKTAVAAYAMLLCAAQGAQAVLMAPTEVLARQHFQTLSQLLRGSQVHVRYLAGMTTAKEKAELQTLVASGDVDLLVGTQAVISQSLPFRRLALVIIDEQHKFGVAQRAVLRQGSIDPHALVMTATPIPRTIAMTSFGDLEVSSLKASPPGRQPVYTYLGNEARRAAWWDFFRRKLRTGQQGFVIAPLVEGDGDEEEGSTSAEAALEHLANGELADFRLNLLHGRMPADQKLDVMRQFAAGETQVLVATSVVEVGIDVPNANLMTIEQGERFGLSQLHQLRGRVGRGTAPGFVCVFAEPKSAESQRRLEAFAATRDGFELAEIDFQLRGPGEIFGTRQHGLPPLMVADLRRDAEILAAARTDARAVVARSPQLADPEWHLIRKRVLARYGRALQLGDVG